MRNLILVLTALLISSSIFSQHQIENITKGYLITLGTIPDAKQITKMKETKDLDATSLNQVLNYLNNYIFKNRETVQRDLIRRTYFLVLKIQPSSQEVEDYYNSTAKRSKNYTELISEFKTYFKSDINYPE